MREVHADLLEHFGLSARSFCFAWEIRRQMGALQLAPEGYTNHDRDISSGGVLYRSSANTAPTSIPFGIGASNNALEATLLFDGFAFDERAVALGAYDGARVKLRALNWRDPEKSLLLFGGFLGAPHFDGEQATFELNPTLSLLGEEMGRIYGPRCPYPRFGRGLCRNGADVDGASDGPDIANYTRAGSVIGVSSNGHFRVGGAAAGAPDGWSNFGVVRFESGANAGGEWDVVKHLQSGGAGEVWLALPTTFRVQIGDAVALERGCNRTKEDCIARANYVNFGGFPNFPLEEGLKTTREN